MSPLPPFPPVRQLPASDLICPSLAISHLWFTLAEQLSAVIFLSLPLSRQSGGAAKRDCAVLICPEGDQAMHEAAFTRNSKLSCGSMRPVSAPRASSVCVFPLQSSVTASGQSRYSTPSCAKGIETLAAIGFLLRMRAANPPSVSGFKTTSKPTSLAE